MPILLTVIILSGPQFATPVRIEAHGKPIDVTTGHAAPYVYDFDGDGTRDLLVGEFGSGSFKGEVHEQGSPGHAWSNGRLRIYHNYGTDTKPLFKDWAYMQGGGETACVPITCCVSFVPQFIDYDNDGIDDVLSASYPGDMYWWKGAGDGTYGAATRLMNKDGNVLLPWEPLAERFWEKAGKKTQNIHSTTAELHDMDADGDLDLWIGSRLNGAFVIENIGTRSTPIWSSHCTALVDSTGSAIGGWSDGGSNIHWADWDGDGVSDVIYGGEYGGIRYCHNSGADNKPILDPPVMLIPDMDRGEMFAKLEVPVRNASRCKVHVVDWDGDGMHDLLVGDFGSAYKKIKTLTPEQIKAKDALEAKRSKLSDEAMPLWNASEPLTPEQKARMEELDAAIDAIWDESQQYEEYEHSSHGWVWFYRQLPDDIAVAEFEAK